MADAAMTVLLETISHMLLSCSDLISGAEDELRLLGDEVESFRAFLRDVADKPKAEGAFAKTERRIEGAVYDAQDAIDSYLMAAASAQNKLDLFRRRRQLILTKLVRKLAEDVRSYREEKVKPALDKARLEFPKMLRIGDGSDSTILEESHQIEVERLDADSTQLLDNVSMALGGDLISGAEEELRQLMNDVELMTVFLQNAANKPNKEEPLRKIETQITWGFLRYNEIVSSYLRNACEAKCMTDLFSSLAELVRLQRKDKVKPVLEKARIEFAETPLNNCEGSATNLEEPHQIEVNKVWSIGEDRSIGLKDDQATIIDYLKEETERLDVIAIIGMAGIGKTTLARRVFQSPEIQYQFPTRIWVTASQALNRTDIFVNILREVSSKDMSSVGEDELAEAVNRFLGKRKFLLVLDDVWTVKDFYAIRNTWPTSNRRSKVIITSRFRELGRQPMVPSNSYRMGFLTEDESWELLQSEVFGGLRLCPPELVEIGQTIARKCDGHAFTIVVTGGILVNELSKTQSISALEKAWIEVFEHMNVSNYGKREFILRVVKLGYDRLPYELRNLFLFLGMFPEDFEIPVTTLIRLWIAEGFIKHEEGRSLEDVAEENLKHLIERKLLIVDKVRSNGKAKSCHLHDILREFCVSKGTKVNLFEGITHSGPPETLYANKMDRRLCIHFDLLKVFSSISYIPHVRSFSCFYKTESQLLPEETSKIPGDAFELLRVLDIKHIRFTRFPLELTQLFCLRYIVLSSDFKILPEAISMLRNIQTLTIHTSSRTLEIKADIWKMNQLRHLQTNASIILRKEPETHSDQELQTLTNLSPENCTSSVVHRSRCLKKLGIRGTLPILLDGEVGSRKFDNFENLKELENLKLLNDVHISSPSECRLSCLPPTENFPPKLRSLTLSATFLSWEHMSVVGMLEKLEVLKLRDNAFVGECWEVADDSFPSLQVLQIGYTNLVSWKVARGHFPKLRSLAIRNCEKLEALPLELENAASLKEIELLRPSKALTSSTRKIVEKRKQNEGNYSRMKLTIYFPADE